MHPRFLLPISVIFILFGMLITNIPLAANDEPSPKILLNHFWLIVDHLTYVDIVESEFIRKEFAHFEERKTVVNNNESYSGAYVYGTNTYFEFFDQSNALDFIQAGLTSGIAFGVEKKGEIKIIQQRFKDYKNGMYFLRSRELEGIQIPWFTMTAVFYGDVQPDIMTWVMEYHEDFLKSWHADLVPTTPGISRKDILKRYAAKIVKPELPKDKILKDVIEVNFQLNEHDQGILLGELAVLDFVFSQGENKKICTGPDLKIIIERIDSGVGKITGIKMSTHTSRNKEVSFSFGKNSRLILHTDNTATWTF